jgi:hypothetical protein
MISINTLNIGTANSIAELIELVHEAEQRFKTQMWFRGHSELDWSLVPGAHRDPAILESERAKRFRLNASTLHANCPSYLDYVSWLPIMQHYGLPTRLLDWTESVLVAVYFAIRAVPPSKDAAIWLLAPGLLNKQSIGEEIPSIYDERIKQLAMQAFSYKPNEIDSRCVSVLTPRSDRRMAAQLGNYTIHGNNVPIELHPESQKFLARILLPASSYEKLARDFSVLGVRQSTLFPDLVNLALELKDITAFDD